MSIIKKRGRVPADLLPGEGLMRLSVVVPVYNAEGTLSRCIDSLLQQEVEGYEVLLVDDGSTDGGRPPPR